MNRDTTIIQVAILMIALAILGIAIWRQQNHNEETKKDAVVKVQEQADIGTTTSIPDAGFNDIERSITGSTNNSGVVITTGSLTERINPDRANLVRQYFLHVEAKEFQQACALMAPRKCAAIRPAAVSAFSQEFLKLKNGYEEVIVKDYGLQSPSGRDIVCVKYSYRYKDDTSPALISEILSYYIEEDVGKWVISDRVCEKKYKEGSGTRPCPVEATQKFCIDRI